MWIVEQQLANSEEWQRPHASTEAQGTLRYFTQESLVRAEIRAWQQTKERAKGDYGRPRKKVERASKGDCSY